LSSRIESISCFTRSNVNLGFPASWFESANIDYKKFPSINFLPDQKDLNNFQCLTAQINSTKLKLDLFITDCWELHAIICRKVLFVKPNKNENNLTKNISNKFEKREYLSKEELPNDDQIAE
jgi:hypothetical protein